MSFQQEEDWHSGFAEICKKPHSEQAKWFLNGFWGDMEENAETVWEYCHHFMELESGKKILYGSKNFKQEEKCDLDEHQSHRFLEKIGEVLTVKELRKRLKKLDIDSNNRLSMTEYLVNKYNKTPKDLVEAPQGGVDPEIIQEAQTKCDSAENMLSVASDSAEAAKKNSEDAKVKTQEATKARTAAEKAAAEAEEALKKSNKKAAEAADFLEKSNQKKEESEVATKKQEEQEKKQAEIQDEVKSAVTALEEAESAYNKEIKDLEDKLAKPKLSAVKRGSFVNQLAQLKGKDPLPLQKAKLTQKAALNKQKKLTKAAKKITEMCRKAEKEAKDAAELANKAKEEADEAAKASAKAKEDADSTAGVAKEAESKAKEAQKLAEESEEKANAAVDEAQKLFKEANTFLEELKNKDEPPKGSIWWMQRIMTEKKKFMPKKRKKQN